MEAKMTLNQAFWSKDEDAVLNGRGPLAGMEDLLPPDAFAEAIRAGHKVALYSHDVAACDRINKEYDAAGSSYMWVPSTELDWETEDEMLTGRE